ncbi:MAG: hypothetical protein GX141_10595 [Armatimonadetes bacterium]|nr:hypothetical protein [Armatimonadota bacterium]
MDKNIMIMPRYIFLLFLMCCASAEASFEVVPPNLAQADRSGKLGEELNYLCLRQLGADCRERLVFGSDSYLPDIFQNAKPGVQLREHQIRPIASIIFAGSALLRFGEYDENASGISRREMARAMISLTRELTAHHCANSEKSSWWWGNEWQSAYWAALAGQGAWIMWDRLPSAVRASTARMIAFEADRFLGGPAPHNEYFDSKAEENAWNSEALVLASCMMPDHPNRKRWDEKAAEYIVTSFAAPKDLQDTKPVDGRPLKDWLHGANIHSDYTLENHGFFHPDYETAYYLTIQNLPFYRLAQREPPEGTFHNIRELHDIVNFLTLPNCWTFYPQYTDWNNYRHDVTIMAQMGNPIIPSAVGARCLRWGLDFLKYADKPNEGKLPQNLFRAFNFNCCPLDTMTHVYLMHYLFGPGEEPLTDVEARRHLSATRIFDEGKVAVCRSSDSIASFSWFDSGKRLMAAVAPMALDCVVIPKYRSLVGIIGDKLDDAKILEREVAPLNGGGFAARLFLSRGPGQAVGQNIAMTSLPDGRAIWAERFVDQPPSNVDIRTGQIFFEMDSFSLRGVKAKVFSNSETWKQTDKSLIMSDVQWLNLSDRLGIVLRGSKKVYIDNGQVVLNYRCAGEEYPLDYMVAIFYPNTSRAATIELNERIKVTRLGETIKIDLGDREITLF